MAYNSTAALDDIEANIDKFDTSEIQSSGGTSFFKSLENLDDANNFSLSGEDSTLSDINKLERVVDSVYSKENNLLSALNEKLYLLKSETTSKKEAVFAELLHKWEGTILSIDSKERCFVAIVKDKSAKATHTERMKLSSSAIMDIDLDVFEVGAVFYWTISYMTNEVGTKIKQSKIRLRRLNGISTKEINVAKRKAAEFLKKLER